MTDVQVSRATLEDHGALANLMQFYIHDFSEFWSGTPQGELGEDGRFEPYPLDAYWREPSRIPLLLRLDGRLAGFALLNAVGHAAEPIDRNMAEFFIVRKHRRGGVGTAAARKIFSLHPGRWEVAVARRNLAALPFWRQAITGHAAVVDVEELNLSTGAWNGPLFRFRVVGN
jgi:predicted acetyltransferase